MAVFSASKRPTAANATAAAITVLTRDDLRRNGVTSLADALALALRRSGLTVTRTA